MSDQHINDDELEQVLQDEGKNLDEVRAHVAQCPECSRRIAAHSAGKTILNKVRTMPPVEARDCPPHDVWGRVATGDLENAGALLEHAAFCQKCSSFLRDALESQTAEVAESVLQPHSMHETELLRGLAKKMAASYAATEEPAPVTAIPSKFRFSSRQIFVGALAAGIVIAVSAVLLLRPSSTDRLIADAYGERRTVEFRIAGVDHAPIQVARGAGAAGAIAVPLRKAEEEVDKGLAAHPDSTEVLQQAAIIQLLEGKFAKALGFLDRIQGPGAAAPEILEDRALAYFERAQTENRRGDYELAVEQLGRILQSHPQDRIALFNRAITFEHLEKFHEAAADWKRFLELETSGGWADEAREHLAAIVRRPPA